MRAEKRSGQLHSSTCTNRAFSIISTIKVAIVDASRSFRSPIQVPMGNHMAPTPDRAAATRLSPLLQLWIHKWLRRWMELRNVGQILLCNNSISFNAANIIPYNYCPCESAIYEIRNAIYEFDHCNLVIAKYFEERQMLSFHLICERLEQRIFLIAEIIWSIKCCIHPRSLLINSFKEKNWESHLRSWRYMQYITSVPLSWSLISIIKERK